MNPAQGRSWLRLPAVQALMIQCGALVIAGSFFLLAQIAGIQIPAIFFLLFQGVLAALASRKRRLASWWLYIQFFFPIALWAGQMLSLPPRFFLACFLFLVALFWSTFRTQVPFYPSRRQVWDAVAELLPNTRSFKMLDVGSGLGGLICYLAARRPDASFSGVEAAPLPWLISRMRKRIVHGDSHFMLGDYNRLDWGCYDVLFAYLSPAAMPALWEKACREMRPGALLLSYEFAIPEVGPQIRLQPKAHGPFLYGWYM